MNPDRVSRAEWLATADHWLAGLRPYASADHAGFHLPGRASVSGPDSDALEAFSRSLVLASCRLAAGEPAADLAGWYAAGLAAGPDTWPRGTHAGEGLAQPTVEAAVLALALDLSRTRLWDHLDPGVQDRLVGWLHHHATLRTWANNWRLFPAACEAFLRSVGADTTGLAGAEHVAAVEEWYLGDGWYTDGAGRNVDHYTGWAIHVFLGLWYRLADPAGLPRWRSRLAAFSQSYQALFAPAPLLQGRSLTYRLAALAPIWLAAGEGVLDPGTARAVADGTLRHFLDLGVGVTAPLTLGWRAAEHLPSCQGYSGPGSPYYAGLGFLGLALPVDHPVWTAAPEPLPDTARTLPFGWIATRAAGVARIANHGSDHTTIPFAGAAGADPDDPHYAKFGYATHAAPGTGPAWDDGIDNHFALLSAAGAASRRGPIRGHLTAPGIAASVHVPQRDGRPWAARVVTVSAVHGPYELRLHLTDTSLPVREGGFALAADVPPVAGVTGGVPWVRQPDGLLAAVVPLRGWQHARIARYLGASALGDHSAVPVLEAAAPSPVHAALHVLGHLDLPSDDLLPTFELAGRTLTVAWPAGPTATLDLAPLIA
ncbi:MAG: DUF2264 domain-containing protein [Mycobacteriales bacterium]